MCAVEELVVHDIITAVASNKKREKKMYYFLRPFFTTTKYTKYISLDYLETSSDLFFGISFVRRIQRLGTNTIISVSV